MQYAILYLHQWNVWKIYESACVCARTGVTIRMRNHRYTKSTFPIECEMSEMQNVRPTLENNE